MNNLNEEEPAKETSPALTLPGSTMPAHPLPTRPTSIPPWRVSEAQLNAYPFTPNFPPPNPFSFVPVIYQTSAVPFFIGNPIPPPAPGIPPPPPGTPPPLPPPPAREPAPVAASRSDMKHNNGGNEKGIINQAIAGVVAMPGPSSPATNAYDTLYASQTNNAHNRRAHQACTVSASVDRGKNEKKKGDRHHKGKKEENKIHRPAPVPCQYYLYQASGRPNAMEYPDMKLVILDLNGTLLYRPHRHQPTKMIARPSLQKFLAYLFDNFAIMIWTSVKPKNMEALIDVGLGEYKHRLVDRWARDKLGLDEKDYNRNVQCYKDLQAVWKSIYIQEHMRGYEQGKRFTQANTILIDDSALKASAQPYNLVEIPEFKGDDTNAGVPDVLAEVAGYLEILKMQEDVSRFIRENPFRASGTWGRQWAELGIE